MTIGTLIPFTLVFAAVNGEILPVVIERRRGPGRFGMATRTISREMRRRVVGIGGLVVIVEVTSRAVGGCAGITGGMAFGAIDRLVRSFQREIGGIVVKIAVSVARRVTGQAGRAVVGIPADAIVFVVRFRVGMAGNAGEFGKI